MPSVVLEGILDAVRLDFQCPNEYITSLQAIEDSGPPQRHFFVLLGNGTMRYFDQEPIQDDVKTAGSISEVLENLEKEQDTTNCKLLGEINISSSRTKSRLNPLCGMISVTMDRQTLLLAQLDTKATMPIETWSDAFAEIKNGAGGGARGASFNSMVGLTGIGSIVGSNRSLDAVLSSEDLYPKFKSFLKYSFAQENYEFLEIVKEYEQLLKNANSSKTQLFTKLKIIVDKYIREGAAQQVNLSSDSRRALTTIVDDNAVQTGDLAKIFERSKHEVRDLMARNFLSRFWRKRDKEAKSEALLKNLSGSYGKIWRIAGINGYQNALDHLQKTVVNEVINFRAYIEQILLIAQYQWQGLEQAEEANLLPTGQVSSNTVTNAIKVFRVGFGYRKSVIQQYMNNVRSKVLPGIEDLTSTLLSSVKDIQQKYKPAIDEILEANQNLSSIRSSCAQERQELMNQQNALKAKKSSKKTEKALGEIQQQLVKIEEKLSASELELGMVESKQTEPMLQAMESLESLEFFRLEKMRDVLIRQASAEQDLVERFRSLLEPMITHAVDADPVHEIVENVSRFESQSMVGRPTSIMRHRS